MRSEKAPAGQRRRRRWSPGWIVGTAVLCIAATLFGVVGYQALVESGHGSHVSGHGSRYVDPAYFANVTDFPTAPPAPAVRPGGSTGYWRVDCGRNQEGRHNSDNVVISPGMVGGAHHVHDYVGNVSTDAFSTDQSLAAAGTTCGGDDKSTYFWPVMRIPGGTTGPGAYGKILVPDAVLIEYRGNPLSDVVPMPRFLRAGTGNPHGYTSGGVGTEHVQWSCSGKREHVGQQYPRCPSGQQVVRVFDFPSCWNGRTTDSADHRSHLVFPGASGACPRGTFPVPRLHVELSYTLPPGVDYAIDTFPEELDSPITDHAFYIDVTSEASMATVVDCVNSGRHCDS
ncbi:DUF1996 domain-containing protein [Saccharopolyspora sp. K220]|uniref:DUF1996 domain-containing protein n=1 Tax=Saccharopolyspora soli TaxID=2926618 RepID=UPI001F5735F7|nr:DUF1996 domain-containing protein [Saccharopolyspora soli]MCI2416901.1 DUF1996 domain-containing protein [Saccharopolyspora soli]